MENTQPVDQEKYSQLISQIYLHECPTLDVGNKNGHTGYIDYIRQTDFSQNVVKGCDSFGRQFIVFRADFVSENGDTKKTFTTFFKRYSDRETLYHAAGHDGLLLFRTEGGTTVEQMQFLLDLLEKKEVVITPEMVKILRLNCYPVDEYITTDDLTYDKSLVPIKVRLGYN